MVIAGVSTLRRAETTSSPRVGRQRHRALALLMVVPAVLFVAVFVLYPLVEGVYRSFFNYNGANLNDFVGFGNYVAVWNDPLFLPSFANVGILTAALMVQSVAVALLGAWLIHHLKSDRAKYIARVAVMLPAVVPTIVGFLIWSQLLSLDGAVNRVLGFLGAEGLAGDWLGDPSRVITGLILVSFPWLNGINCLLFLAALESIPREIYEAAMIDRANWWTVLRRIEIPAIIPQAVVLTVLAAVLGLQNYENVYVLTGGGPFNSSNVPGLLLFKQAFNYGKFGYASTIGVMLVIVISAVLVAGRWIGRGAER